MVLGIISFFIKGGIKMRYILYKKEPVSDTVPEYYSYIAASIRKLIDLNITHKQMLISDELYYKSSSKEIDAKLKELMRYRLQFGNIDIASSTGLEYINTYLSRFDPDYQVIPVNENDGYLYTTYSNVKRSISQHLPEHIVSIEGVMEDILSTNKNISSMYSMESFQTRKDHLPDTDRFFNFLMNLVNDHDPKKEWIMCRVTPQLVDTVVTRNYTIIDQYKKDIIESLNYKKKDTTIK